MKLKTIILFSAFLTITALKAQQLPVYTQYVFNEYIMNPAVAGTVDRTPIRLSYRDQWAGFKDYKGNNNRKGYGFVLQLKADDVVLQTVDNTTT